MVKPGCPASASFDVQEDNHDPQIEGRRTEFRAYQRKS
jgi:hypothetical protein